MDTYTDAKNKDKDKENEERYGEVSSIILFFTGIALVVFGKELSTGIAAAGAFIGCGISVLAAALNRPNQ